METEPLPDPVLPPDLPVAPSLPDDGSGDKEQAYLNRLWENRGNRDTAFHRISQAAIYIVGTCLIVLVVCRLSNLLFPENWMAEPSVKLVDSMIIAPAIGALFGFLVREVTAKHPRS